MLILVERSNFTLAFVKAACYVNLGAARNFAGSSSYTSRHILCKDEKAKDAKTVCHRKKT